ncbi:PLDc N-terminal domain-containing protein [Chryseobacterium sp. SL1]|uniref:PLDc N-terminal domain-containing protein n=1 Tax=Chryseobacterium sp. SL1 TaxID=2995159 RepID=UPI002275703F|nr:PLDc N-terminal domain-containing protein [Chryseobacterium sp. SL1]MCY1660933.1 PLDc N-terminal domain-containing protein [Chryseobacterium sp. SL1]
MNEDYQFNPSTGEFEKGTTWRKTKNNKNDRGIGLWGIAFLFFPYIGLVIYFFIRYTKPNKAKSILYWSIAGGIVLVISMMDN